MLDRAVAKWMALAPEERTSETVIRYACHLRHTSPQEWALKKSEKDLRRLAGGTMVEFVDSFIGGQQNAAVIGPSGAGKTLALTLIARGAPKTMNPKKLESMLRRYTGSAVRFLFQELTERRCAWINVPRLAEIYRAQGWGAGVPREVEIAKIRPLLFLDDLGSDGKGAEEALYTIADERYNRGLRTVLSSGSTLLQLSDRYGEHIIRRLTERRGAAPLVCEVTDV